jgi:hypothetical protein
LSLSQVALAGVPHSKAARQIIAKRAKVAEASLTALEESAATLQETDVRFWSYKFAHEPSLRFFRIDIDERSGLEVSGESLITKEIAAKRALYGALLPAQLVKLQGLPESDTFDVIIWTEQPSNTPIFQLLDNPDAAKNAFTIEATAPVRNAIANAYPSSGVSQFTGLFALKAKLTVRQMLTIAYWSSVAGLDFGQGQIVELLSPKWYYSLNLNRAHTTTTGNGVGVGVHEMGQFVPGQTGIPAWSVISVASAGQGGGPEREHAQSVVGMIVNNNLYVRPGTAPGARVYFANGCGMAGCLLSNFETAQQLMSGSNNVATNFSYVDGDEAVTPSGFRKFKYHPYVAQTGRMLDQQAFHLGKVAVAGAGNGGDDTDFVENQHVGSPANGLNVIAVGAADMNYTSDRADDYVGHFSSWRDPLYGIYNDRPKPELVAPSSGVYAVSGLNAPQYAVNRFGTSLAAPIVVGTLGLVANKRALSGVPGRLTPDVSRALLVVSATQDTDGSPNWLSAKDGAGELDAEVAVNSASNTIRFPYGQTCQPTGWRPIPGSSITLRRDQKARVAIAFDSLPRSMSAAYAPTADIDLVVTRWDGTGHIGVFGTSSKFEATTEAVEFTAPVAGTYVVGYWTSSCATPPQFIGHAWATF